MDWVIITWNPEDNSPLVDKIFGVFASQDEACKWGVKNQDKVLEWTAIALEGKEDL